MQVNEVEREKISFQYSEPEPGEHHIITDHQGSCCWKARADREKRNAAKTPEAAAEARALRWRATLQSGRRDSTGLVVYYLPKRKYFVSNIIVVCR